MKPEHLRNPSFFSHIACVKCKKYKLIYFCKKEAMRSISLKCFFFTVVALLYSCVAGRSCQMCHPLHVGLVVSFLSGWTVWQTASSMFCCSMTPVCAAHGRCFHNPTSWWPDGFQLKGNRHMRGLRKRYVSCVCIDNFMKLVGSMKGQSAHRDANAARALR